ncbi:hypothetical protein D9619_011919 [Psilocybe cf. subviscida]|uniref:Transmembrane protein n=1 Tax=Psilocybe cf. subviscida TaxID=2480587 RepID=A0A8H5B0P0_9AGAR|nr:hypothetical protein D9619_011919 [Psilocybe cf. subviscida]
MDAGVLHGMLQQSSNSDGTTIIILGPSGQVQMGNGIGRPGDSMNTPSVPDPAPPDRNQPPGRDQPSDGAGPPTPIMSLTQNMTPTETSSPAIITDTPAIKSTTEPSDRSSESPMASTSATLVESSDALPTLSSSSLTETSLSVPSDSSSLSLPESSTTKAVTRSSSALSTPVLTSKSPTATTSGHSSRPSSTSHSQASSLLSSGTASQAAATAAYRPLSPNSQQLNTHSPSFYVVVSVAAVVGAAIVVALIAWCIRLLTKARRRRRSRRTTVPWGNPPNDKENRMEVGQANCEDSFSSTSGTNSGSGRDLDCAQGWLHHGELDVGEVHRGRFDVNGNPLRDHPIIPGRTLPADYAFDEVDLGPYLRPNQNLRHLPSHLVDEDLAARARLETCPVHSNILGPPLSLRGGVFAERGPSPVSGIEKSPRTASSVYENCEEKIVSDEEPTAPPRSMAERLRSIGKSPIEAPCELGAQLPRSDEHQRDEAWAASLKNSLVCAFNAVAVNISGAPRMGDKIDTPTRRLRRQSVRDVRWDKKGSELMRGTSFSSKDSKPWTLEETREGAGVVHLHIDDPREYRTHATATSNSPRTKGSLTSIKPSDTSVLAVAHGRPHQRFLHRGISRESSIYSTLSAFPEWRERPSRQGSINPSVHSARGFMSLRVTNLTHESRQSTTDSIVIRPHPISRLPSTASSATHFHDVQTLEVDAAASRALRERQRKVLNSSQ